MDRFDAGLAGGQSNPADRSLQPFLQTAGFDHQFRISVAVDQTGKGLDELLVRNKLAVDVEDWRCVLLRGIDLNGQPVTAPKRAQQIRKKSGEQARRRILIWDAYLANAGLLAGKTDRLHHVIDKCLPIRRVEQENRFMLLLDER